MHMTGCTGFDKMLLTLIYHANSLVPLHLCLKPECFLQRFLNFLLTSQSLVAKFNSCFFNFAKQQQLVANYHFWAVFSAKDLDLKLWNVKTQPGHLCHMQLPAFPINSWVRGAPVFFPSQLLMDSFAGISAIDTTLNSKERLSQF